MASVSSYPPRTGSWLRSWLAEARPGHNGSGSSWRARAAAEAPSPVEVVHHFRRIVENCASQEISSASLQRRKRERRRARAWRRAPRCPRLIVGRPRKLVHGRGPDPFAISLSLSHHERRRPGQRHQPNLGPRRRPHAPGRELRWHRGLLRHRRPSSVAHVRTILEDIASKTYSRGTTRPVEKRPARLSSRCAA